MQHLAIVNASPVFTDDEIMRILPAMQKQLDRDFYPAWQKHVPEVKLSFVPWAKFHMLDPQAWAIFVNRHSKDDSMLGYHSSEDGRVYGRVYVGDIVRMQLDWTVTLSHEILELIADPSAEKVFRMADGRYAAVEVCDAVEADAQAYLIDGVAVSNFVYPAYFSNLIRGGKYDHRGWLHAACPELTPGGYMPIRDHAGNWSSIYANKADGMLSRRAILHGFRRAQRIVQGSAAAVVEFEA